MYSKTLAILLLLAATAPSGFACEPPDPTPPANCQSNFPGLKAPAPKPPTSPGRGMKYPPDPEPPNPPTGAVAIAR